MGERPQVLAVAGHGHLDLHPVERRNPSPMNCQFRTPTSGNTDCVEHPVGEVVGVPAAHLLVVGAAEPADLTEVRVVEARDEVAGVAALADLEVDDRVVAGRDLRVPPLKSPSKSKARRSTTSIEPSGLTRAVTSTERISRLRAPAGAAAGPARTSTAATTTAPAGPDASRKSPSCSVRDARSAARSQVTAPRGPFVRTSRRSSGSARDRPCGSRTPMLPSRSPRCHGALHPAGAVPRTPPDPVARPQSQFLQRHGQRDPPAAAARGSWPRARRRRRPSCRTRTRPPPDGGGRGTAPRAERPRRGRRPPRGSGSRRHRPPPLPPRLRSPGAAGRCRRPSGTGTTRRCPGGGR